MRKSVQQEDFGSMLRAGERFFKRDLPIALMIIAGFCVAGFAALAAPGGNSTQSSNAAIFTLSKNLCTGTPVANASAHNCSLAPIVAANSPVYYVITLHNPWGQPPQTINLTDPYPANFVPSSGGAFCTNDAGAPVALTPISSPNGVGAVQLGVAATVHCFVPGQFTAAGPQTNTASGENGDKYKASDAVNTQVAAAAPLGLDLAVVKTGDNSIDVSGGPAILNYTIKITNNGPGTANVGDWFQLHDRMSLLPSSVPFTAVFQGATCLPTPGSDCLDFAGPNGPGVNGPVTVGTMGQTHLFSWGFAPNTGTILQGGSLTISFAVEVSALEGLACIAAPNSDGLRNEAFFTLFNTNGTAVSELVPANNSSAVKTSIDTGQTEIVEGCGSGHLIFSKERISPPDLVPWGSKVNYKIFIKNASVPAQPITIKKGDLEDWITEGINTPPFTAQHLSTSCDPAINPVLCAGYSGVNDKTPLKFTYYGQTQEAWDSLDQFTLQHGESLQFETVFAFTEPDCETVPNTKSRPIVNTARIRYEASPYGVYKVSGPSPPPTVFEQSTSATVNMAPQKPCKFTVTKAVTNPIKGNRVFFGPQLDYTVTYKSDEPDRFIGTLMDAVRITIPDYATSVPFTSNWKCNGNTSINGGNIASGSGSGSVSGFAVHTSSPAQGSPAMNLGSNIFFKQGDVLTCNIRLIVKRPPLNDAFCTQKPARFENIALMDVTQPFNTNIFWPPSSTYSATMPSNPPTQSVNWAGVSSELPKCWDAVINKSASVSGLPGGQPWTYASGPVPSYNVQTTNTSQSIMGTPPGPDGWIVTDTFAAPYLNSGVTQTGSTPWCPAPSGYSSTSGGTNDPRSQIQLLSLASAATGSWQFDGPAPQTGQSYNNCASVTAQGAQAGPGWYQNSASPIKVCQQVPVLPVTKVVITKKVVDLTGAGVTVAGPFNISVNCSNYSVPTASASLSVSTTSTGSSAPATVSPVPVASGNICTVTEASPPIPPAAAGRCGGAANVLVGTSITPLPAVLNPTSNAVTVTNTYSCKPTTGTKVVKVVKYLKSPQGAPTVPLNFTINAACTPAATPTSVTVASGQTAVFTVPTGATCTFSETPPPMPLAYINYCNALGHQVPVWDPPAFFPAASGVVNKDKGVELHNSWKCVGGNTRIMQMRGIEPAADTKSTASMSKSSGAASKRR